MQKKYITNSPAQTKNLAKKIAKNFKGGIVLGLVGELGSGKTQFTKGLAEYFGIKQAVTSPTFVLLKPYIIQKNTKTKKQKNNYKINQLIHIDCYRLDSPEELLAIGLQEYINKNNLVVIEWAEKVRGILPKDTIWIKFKLGKNEKERIIKIK